MVWGCLSASGVRDLVNILNAEKLLETQTHTDNPAEAYLDRGKKTQRWTDFPRAQILKQCGTETGTKGNRHPKKSSECPARSPEDYF